MKSFIRACLSSIGFLLLLCCLSLGLKFLRFGPPTRILLLHISTTILCCGVSTFGPRSSVPRRFQCKESQCTRVPGAWRYPSLHTRHGKGACTSNALTNSLMASIGDMLPSSFQLHQENGMPKQRNTSPREFLPVFPRPARFLDPSGP